MFLDAFFFQSPQNPEGPILASPSAARSVHSLAPGIVALVNSHKEARLGACPVRVLLHWQRVNSNYKLLVTTSKAPVTTSVAPVTTVGEKATFLILVQ